MSANIIPAISPTFFGNVILEMIAAGDLIETDPPVQHYHASGVYGRRIFVPAGTCVVTKKHKSQHITIALKGHCTVVDEEGNKHEIVAPDVFITEPGTQRSVYCHTDTEWLTCHHTLKTKVDEIEDELVLDPFMEKRQAIADRKSYALIMRQLGITEQQAMDICEADDLTLQPEDDRVLIAPSDRHGIGVFAKDRFDEGDVIAAARLLEKRTPAGKYCNHSANHNGRFVPSADCLLLVAVNRIEPGDEITVNYIEALDASIRATHLLRGQS